VAQDHWDPFRERLTIDEADRRFVVRANLRGLAVDELQVRVRGDTLTISGATNAEGESRPFCRTLRLPAAVRGDRTDARFEQGVLSLTLPEARHPWPASTSAPARPVGHRAGERRILVVDDDPGIREFVSETLADEGYEVVTAPDGAAALDLIRQGQPEVILLDMRMPVMDGWEFSRAYRELPGPHAPIIAVTAAPDAVARAAQIDADGYLAKPFELQQMLSLVGQHARPS
jgi:two-component system chemotaxis response regulator CheY